VIESAVLWTGVFLSALGVLSILRPLRFLRLRTRAAGAMVLIAGLVVIGLACLLPVHETRIATEVTRLDEFAPHWQFAESHSIRIAAPRARVFRAIERVTAGEIPLFRTLTAIRRMGRRTPDILDAPLREPILGVATRTSFLMLARDVPGEIVIGTIVVLPEGRGTGALVQEGRLPPDQPGLALAFMNFRVIAEDETHTRVMTETRVIAGDPVTARKFAIYWRVIYPGSSLIRRMWLRAIQRRAESDRNGRVRGPNAAR